MTTITATIASMTRIRNSVNDSPRYSIITTDGREAETAKDTADSYGWAPAVLIGREVTLTLSGNRIIGIDPS